MVTSPKFLPTLKLLLVISFIFAFILAPNESLINPTINRTYASDLTPHSITTTGQCITRVPQDRARISVGSSHNASDPNAAARQAVSDHEEIKAAVKALNLKGLTTQTEVYSVRQDCVYDSDGKRRCSGYVATVSTSFESADISRMGEIIALASKMRAKEVSNLATFAAPESLQRYREECLEVAIRNAASKAARLAKGAGVSLNGPLAITESPTADAQPPFIPFASKMMASEAAGIGDAASIEARPIELNVTVSATFAFNR
jgi:uncharacterized protein YggE